MGKRQLAVHTVTNRSLYVSEETRSNRLMRAANFDLGFKEDRGLTSQDPEYNSENKVLVGGLNMIVNPKTKTRCSYEGKCECCGKRFRKAKTFIVGAWIHNGEKYVKKSNDKFYWICYKHFEEQAIDEDSSD